MKFGGAVLSDAHGFSQMTNIVLPQVGTEALLLVVSAIGSTTSALDGASRIAAFGNIEKATAELQEIVDNHRQLASQVIIDEFTLEALNLLIADAARMIGDLLEGIAIVRQRTPRTRDAVLAYGEFLALHIARHAILQHGIDCAPVDARTVIVTDDNYGQALPNLSATASRAEHNLMPVLASHSVVLTQGFVGRALNGDTTTMGKESSNLSATILAKVCNATELIIWTNVSGIRTTDPSVLSTARLVPHLTYEQAALLAYFGLKLFYPTMMEPARSANIPIKVGSPADPLGECTIIDANTGDQPEPMIIPMEQHGKVCVIFASPARCLEAGSLLMEQFNIMYFEVNVAEQVCLIKLPRASVPAASVLLHNFFFP